MKKEKEKVQTNIGIHEITEPSKLVTRKITGEKNNKIQFSYLCVEWTKSLHLLNLRKHMQLLRMIQISKIPFVKFYK